MARINLVPQKREFYDLYNRAAANTVEIAQQLVQLLETYPERCEEHARDIKELEHEGDRLTHDVVDLLNRTFVTPFDRDDMYRLASSIDDVCDHIDEAAGNLIGYGVESIRSQALAQAQVIERAARKLEEAIGLLEGFKDSRRQLIELRELEDEGDTLVRDGISELFRTGEDPLAVIRWKDIFERLEEAMDSCENAADVLEAILVKNR